MSDPSATCAAETSLSPRSAAPPCAPEVDDRLHQAAPSCCEMSLLTELPCRRSILTDVCAGLPYLTPYSRSFAPHLSSFAKDDMSLPSYRSSFGLSCLSRGPLMLRLTKPRMSCALWPSSNYCGQPSSSAPPVRSRRPGAAINTGFPSDEL